MASPTFSNPHLIAELLGFANQLADRAREIGRQYFRQSNQKWTKPDATPVTEADLKIENCIRSLIGERYPDHGIIGEEQGTTNDESSFKWCIDPIDGTKSFVYGVPTFGTLIALTYQSAPIIGVIEHPALMERWCGASGTKTTWQQQSCQTGQNTRLAESVVYATSIDMFSKDEVIIFNRVTSRAKLRQFGVDCHAYSLLASGYIDVVMEADMKPYDMMALVPVVEGAGGVISDWNGNPLTLNSGRTVLATANGSLHQQCLDSIN